MSAAHTITNTGTANTITNTANTVTKTTWSWREADTANWQALLQQLLHLSSTSPALPALGLLPAPLQHCPPLGCCTSPALPALGPHTNTLLAARYTLHARDGKPLACMQRQFASSRAPPVR